jgi:gentisate 1,2-dioxygenase
VTQHHRAAARGGRGQRGEGRGESRIGEQTIAWEEGDVLAVPPWHWVEHRNRSTAGPACLFHLGDEPALRALGLWHEEVGA